MTPLQIAEDAIGLFLEYLEFQDANTLDDNEVERARARALCEISEGTAHLRIAGNLSDIAEEARHG